MSNKILRTVLGDVALDKFGLILPHEHLFTDLRGPQAQDYAQADPKIVQSVMGPYLQEAYQAGATALVECSTIGVGRNVEMLRMLAKTTRMHILAPTGLYREAYIPAAYKDLSIEELAAFFLSEITQGIDQSRSKAGFIKIAVSDDGPRPVEARNIRAAARASQVTGAAIASHTIGGRAAMEELDILKDEGFNLDKFIWVHAGSEPDQSFHIQAASQGAYVEFDSIGGSGEDGETIKAVITLLDQGYGSRVLLSHDAGWFQPGLPGGEPEHGMRGFTALIKDFIPRLKSEGIAGPAIDQMTKDNPLRALSIPV